MLETNIREYEAKECALGSWMVDKLCPGREVPCAATKTGITLNEFTVKA